MAIIPWCVSTFFCLPDISKNFTLVHATLHVKGHAVGTVLDVGQQVASIEKEVFGGVLAHMRKKEMKSSDLKVSLFNTLF